MPLGQRSLGQRGRARRGVPAGGEEVSTTSFGGYHVISQRRGVVPGGDFTTEAQRGHGLPDRGFRSVPIDENRRRRLVLSTALAAARRGNGSSANGSSASGSSSGAAAEEVRQRRRMPLSEPATGGRGSGNGSGTNNSRSAVSRPPASDRPTGEEGASDQAMRLLKRMRPDELREISKAASALEKAKLEDSQKVAAFVAKTDNFVELVGDCYICLEPLLSNIGTTKFGVVSWKCRCTVPQKAHSGCVFSKICHGQNTCGMCHSPMKFEKTRRKGKQATIWFHRGEKSTDSETSDSSGSESDSSDSESEGDGLVEEDEEDDGDENDGNNDDDDDDDDDDAEDNGGGGGGGGEEGDDDDEELGDGGDDDDDGLVVYF